MEVAEADEDWIDPSIESGNLDLVETRSFDLDGIEVAVNLVAVQATSFSVMRYPWPVEEVGDPPNHFMGASDEDFEMDLWPWTGY